MRLKKLLSVIIILFNCQFFCSAQFKKNPWFQGQVQLADNQKFDVALRLLSERSEGLLQVKEEGQLITLSPVKVKSFQFFDEAREQQRKFVSLATNINQHQYKKNMFFEVFFQGKSISLLGRTDSFNMSSFESLYIHDHKENLILPFTTSKWVKRNIPVYQKPNLKVLYAMAGDLKNDLKNYINANNLSLKDPEDMIALLTHFDHLATATSQN